MVVILSSFETYMYSTLQVDDRIDKIDPIKNSPIGTCPSMVSVLQQRAPTPVPR